MKKITIKIKKSLPTSVRLREDVREKVQEFMERENREFPNAIDELLRIAFGKISAYEKDMAELKARLARIEAIELHEHGPDSPLRKEIEGKKISRT